ncbi:MAG TPA: hypothetical protein VFV38_09915 [Ktedonobacteraceae bacterium]|nr:hypothetical protein [Ktedonobacteraceae bacterium]
MSDARKRQESGQPVSARMICYASRTGTRRNLDALRQAGWRLLISRTGNWRTEGFPYALDNGAWSDFQSGRPFDEENFERLLEKLGANADFVVLPDIVEGGMRSLDLSVRWLNRSLSVCPRVVIAVQDGMEPCDLASLVSPSVGIFLGGSTEWKLQRMADWGHFCAERHVYYHVARVNTLRRIRLAAAAGAISIDGSSASRYAITVRPLDFAARQPDLFAPLTEKRRRACAPYR